MDEAPPTSLVRSLSFQLMGAGRHAEQALDAAWLGTGLTRRHLGVLGHLRREPGLTHTALARRAGVTVQSLHATVSQLREQGLVDAGHGGGRGRPAHLTVTAAGSAALDDAATRARAADEQLVARLSQDDRAALRRGLAALIRTLGPPGVD